MKVRTCFVANSSSSSYVCTCCGDSESGWDLCLSDINWIECENGHILCCSCQKDKDLTLEQKISYIERSDSGYYKKKLEEINPNDEDYKEDIESLFEEVVVNYGYPKETCSFCNLETITSEDGLNYLLKKYNLTKKDLKKEIKEKFGVYDEFKKYLKG